MFEVVSGYECDIEKQVLKSNSSFGRSPKKVVLDEIQEDEEILLSKD